MPSADSTRDHDAAGQHAIETVAGIVLEEHDLAGRVAPGARMVQQLARLAVGERSKEGMQAAELLRCHRGPGEGSIHTPPHPASRDRPIAMVIEATVSTYP